MNIFKIDKSIIKSSSLLLLGSVASRALFLLASMIVVRFINKDVYGEFGIIKSTINTFTVFAGLGLGLTATKYISEFKDENKSRVNDVMGLSTLFATIFCLVTAITVYFNVSHIANYINAPHLVLELKVAIFILAFSAFSGVQNGILSGFESFKFIAINTSLAALLSLVFQIYGAYKFGLIGLLIGFGSNYFFLVVFNIFSIRSFKEFKYSLFSKSNFKEVELIWKFSVPAVLSGIMVGPVVWITSGFLVNQDKGFEYMADFEVANQWRAAVLFIPSALAQVVLPILSKTSDSMSFKNVIKQNIFINLLVSIVVVAILILMVPIIVSFYGTNFETAREPLIIMLLTTCLVAINNVIGQGIAGKGKMWYGFLANAIWALVLIISSYIFINWFRLNAIGLAYAYLISYSVHTIIQFLLLKSILKDDK